MIRPHAILALWPGLRSKRFGYLVGNGIADYFTGKRTLSPSSSMASSKTLRARGPDRSPSKISAHLLRLPALFRWGKLLYALSTPWKMHVIPVTIHLSIPLAILDENSDCVLTGGYRMLCMT
jgi:hypothetical protein